MSDALRPHQTVLLHAAVHALNIRADGRYMDATFGRGGHSEQILASLGTDGHLVGIDRDPAAVAAGQALSARDQRFTLVQSRFSALGDVADTLGWRGKVDGILLDIGVSSPQLDEPSRGFSFMREGPLDMRMDPTAGASAAEWLAQASVEEIHQVLRDFGEERFSYRIAKAIVEHRAVSPLRTTLDLTRLIERVSPRTEKHKHPATRTFQAIRVFINQELEELVQALEQALEVLALGGRLVVISFHSLEDRIVKRFFRDQARGDAVPKHFALTADQLKPRLKTLGKAMKADADEIAGNPRARSAVMRVAEKLA